MSENIEDFCASAASLGICLDQRQQDAFATYRKILLEANEQFNLLGPAAVSALWSRHFLDALTIIRALPQPAALAPICCLDVGTGAGIPGIPLQIAFPLWRVTLLEATTKKVRFLERAAQDLGLEHTRIVHGRAEIIAHDREHREQYDLVVARAVTHASALVELTLPFVAGNGWAILYKSGSALSEELQEAEAARAILGAAAPAVIPAGLLESESRCLVRYAKLSRTPSPLPRGAGIPEHRALTAADGARIWAAQETRPSR